MVIQRIGSGPHGWTCGYCNTSVVGYQTMAETDWPLELHLRACSAKRMLLTEGRR